MLKDMMKLNEKVGKKAKASGVGWCIEKKKKNAEQKTKKACERRSCEERKVL